MDAISIRHAINLSSDIPASPQPRRRPTRQRSAALHHIAKVRLATDPETRAYAAKLTSAGKSKKEVLAAIRAAVVSASGGTRLCVSVAMNSKTPLDKQ
ncbi:hypothetical protein ACPCG0_13725 [Propionibacteriaceae bacterium Y1923]